MRPFSFLSFLNDSPRRKKAAPKMRPALEVLEDRSLPSCSSVSGFVYEDMNNNGLFDTGEQPIANSTIELRDEAGTVIASAVTDANGFYEFTHDETISQEVTSLTREVVFPATQTNFSLEGLLDQFDPELGELQSIEISYEGSITSTIRAENTSPTSASAISGKVGGTLTLSAPNAEEAIGLEENAGSFNAAIFDGTNDFGGTSGHNFGTETASGQKSLTLTGAAMDPYKGTGKVTVTATVEASSNASGGGNISVDLNSSAEAEATVQYNYIPNPCLKPGGYSIVQTPQPAGYMDGKESSAGVVLTTPPGIDAIPITIADEDLADNNFGEIKPALLSGHVWFDADDDGERDAGEEGIAGVVVSLSGVAEVGEVEEEATTNTDGLFEFKDLLAGTYTLAETQPAGWKDGKDSLGSLGGDMSDDAFAAIVVGTGAEGLNYDFGEKEPDRADLAVVKTAGTQSVLAGSLLSYTITVTNNGPGGASNVQVSDTLPAGATLVDADGEGWTVSSENNVIVASRAALASEQVSIVNVTIQAPKAAGDLVNTVEVSSATPDPEPGNNRSSVTTPVIDNPGRSLDIMPLAQPVILSKVELLVGPGAPVAPPGGGFVDGVLRTLLDRAATPAELGAFTAQINGGLSRKDFVAAILGSGEQQQQEARRLYEAYLDRSPTAEEQAALAAQLGSGLSRNEAIVMLLTSEEYVQTHPGQHGLVAGFHVDLTGQLPNASVLAASAQAMSNEPLEDFARDLLGTDEALSQQIDEAYHVTLRRGATASEIGFWTTQLKSGVTYNALVQDLLGGEEFIQLTGRR